MPPVFLEYISLICHLLLLTIYHSFQFVIIPTAHQKYQRLLKLKDSSVPLLQSQISQPSQASELLLWNDPYKLDTY